MVLENDRDRSGTLAIRAPEDDHLHPVTSIIQIHRLIRLVINATP
jgi:hypothetical protein